MHSEVNHVIRNLIILLFTAASMPVLFMFCNDLLADQLVNIGLCDFWHVLILNHNFPITEAGQEFIMQIASNVQSGTTARLAFFMMEFMLLLFEVIDELEKSIWFFGHVRDHFHQSCLILFAVFFPWKYVPQQNVRSYMHSIAFGKHAFL